MTGQCSGIPLPQTVANVEAAAARRAIILARDLNLNSIILEGDSQIITRAIQAEEQSLASYGNLIEEIKIHANSFLNFRISHVKRKGNSIAHNFARHAKHVSGSVVWMEEVPSHILPILLAEAGLLYILIIVDSVCFSKKNIDNLLPMLLGLNYISMHIKM